VRAQIHTPSLCEAIRLRQRGEYTRAWRILRQLHRADPDDVRINYQCAWVCDLRGNERAAVPFYERAIQRGLFGEDLRGALLGLGSTYRCLGDYRKSATVLRRGLRTFPKAREFSVFLALVEYNRGHHASAMELLLRTLVETTRDSGLRRYQRALLYYADKLDRKWN
jgi:tetratricopeptide (TPR) repeat protein